MFVSFSGLLVSGYYIGSKRRKVVRLDLLKSYLLELLLEVRVEIAQVFCTYYNIYMTRFPFTKNTSALSHSLLKPKLKVHVLFIGEPHLTVHYCHLLKG